MPSKDNRAEDYVECFKGQPEGWFMYHPIKSSALKQGMCGYFDVDGMWQTIVDLTNPDDARKKNLRPVHGVTFSGGNQSSTKHWGRRMSTDTKEEDVSAEFNASVPGAAGGGLTLKYSATSDKAALLLTKGPVKYLQATPNGPPCEWVVENGKEILRRTRKSKRGVWIVTKTYSANHRRLTVLSAKGRGVTVGIDAIAFNDSGEEEGIVLAMCGIWWKTRWYSSKTQPVEERRSQTLDGEIGDLILRPHDLKLDVVEGEDHEMDEDAVRVEPEMWGEVAGVAIGDEEEVENGDH